MRSRAELDELRSQAGAAAAQREELGKRVSRWQDRFDQRLHELTVKMAQLAERQKLVSTQLSDLESRHRAAKQSGDRHSPDDGTTQGD